MEMKIKFYDVEHGSCTHIITPNKQHFLVDIGSKSTVSMAKHLKDNYLTGLRDKVDYLIITHPHEDHIYDLPMLEQLKISPKVLRRPKSAFDIKPKDNTELHRKIADTANSMNARYNSDIENGKNPINEDYNGGIHFEFISPKAEWIDINDLNSHSSLIILKYEGYKFVLTGDNPKSILQKMMDENYNDIRNKIKDATVLLAPHHGRKGEFCNDFFVCVNPYLTVISDKSIVHETQENSSTLYKGRGAKLYGVDRYVLTTRSEGTITFDVDREHCEVYWSKEEY